MREKPPVRKQTHFQLESRVADAVRWPQCEPSQILLAMDGVSSEAKRI